MGVEPIEVNPVVDPSCLTPYVGLRTLKEVLVGMAMRKKKITDPF